MQKNSKVVVIVQIIAQKHALHLSNSRQAGKNLEKY